MSDDLDLDQSVAGEEDPGASMDVGPPAVSPGTGEDVCPSCGGTGRAGNSACPACGGTGKVTIGIGGA